MFEYCNSLQCARVCLSADLYCSENEGRNHEALLKASPHLSVEHDMLRAHTCYVLAHLLQNDVEDAFSSVDSDIKETAAKIARCDVGETGRQNVIINRHADDKGFYLHIFLFLDCFWLNRSMVPAQQGVSKHVSCHVTRHVILSHRSRDECQGQHDVRQVLRHFLSTVAKW